MNSDHGSHNRQNWIRSERGKKKGQTKDKQKCCCLVWVRSSDLARPFILSPSAHLTCYPQLVSCIVVSPGDCLAAFRARCFHPPVSSVPLFPHSCSSLIHPSLATERKSESGKDDRLLFAVLEMQRWISMSPTILHPFFLTILIYPAMEDAHMSVLTLRDGTEENNALFGAYDGHGGSSLPPFWSLISLPTYRQHCCKIFHP